MISSDHKELEKKDKLGKSVLKTIDSKTAFRAIKQTLSPPSTGHTCKEKGEGSFGRREQLTTAVLVALILLWHVRPHPTAANRKLDP